MRGAWAIIVAACVLAGTAPAGAGSVQVTPPAQPDPAAKYLFYMHGGSVENGRPVEGVPVEYEKILQALAERGFIVMGERRRPVDPGDYARRIVTQVQGLLANGVPAHNITVSGHSKGGMISMLAATLLDDLELSFISMAGCARLGGGAPEERGTRAFVENQAAKMHGRFLILYDRADRLYGPCPPQLFERATGLSAKHETVLSIGRGHATFARPDPLWLDAVEAWAEGRTP